MHWCDDMVPFLPTVPVPQLSVGATTKPIPLRFYTFSLHVSDEVSGSGKEWAYAVKNITIPYTIELRDKGQLGFLLPPEDIIPVARELTEGFVGMVRAAREIGVL